MTSHMIIRPHGLREVGIHAMNTDKVAATDVSTVSLTHDLDMNDPHVRDLFHQTIDYEADTSKIEAVRVTRELSPAIPQGGDAVAAYNGFIQRMGRVYFPLLDMYIPVIRVAQLRDGSWEIECDNRGVSLWVKTPDLSMLALRLTTKG